MPPKDMPSQFEFDYNRGADYDISQSGYETMDCNASSSRENDHLWDEHEFMNLFSPMFFQETTMKRHSELAGPFELLNAYRNGLKLPREEENQAMMIEPRLKLSMEDVLRVAGERFIRFRTNRANDGISPFIHPYGPPMSGLCMDDARDVELVHLLLAAADYTGSKRYDIASKLMTRCLWVASSSGSPVQRIAFYFTKGLMSKIGRETGSINHEAEKQNTNELALGDNNTFLECHQKLPFVQVLQISAVQAIIDSVKKGSKIHVIDLQIRSGIQWTALMQGLVDQGIERLKVTAIGMRDQLYMEETGKRLASFAQSLSLKFCFDVVYLQDMNDFKVDCLSVGADETLLIYASTMLRSMLSRPECLDNVMREIIKLEPDLMVVIEVEGNHNSPSFVGRFVEALFFYAAFFDCLKDCMGEDSPCRTVVEAEYLGQGIRNVVAAEGQERVTRNVKIDVWRAFFARYGMKEIELSQSARYQARLVLKKYENESSWDVEDNGKGLIVGWKGTPLHSLTVWKFSYIDENMKSGHDLVHK